MIKLNRKFTPIKLTPKFVSEKTAKYKKDNSSVWNINWLKEALLELSYEKCAYCECSLSEESNYMEIEHFEDKARYPNKVMLWSNLLPSCKKCNGSKSSHDVNLEPIINPFIDNPRDEIYFRLYRLKGKTIKGKNTENIVNINHPTRSIVKRFEVGEALQNLIEIANERIFSYLEKKTISRRNKALNLVEAILLECQPNSIYSSTCSTILHSNINFIKIKEIIEAESLWNDELENLYNKSKQIILEIK